MVPTADNLIQVKISGDAKIIGMENGNPVDHDPYKSDRRRVFNGMGIAIIKSGKTAGKIEITALSDGIRSGIIEILASK